MNKMRLIVLGFFLSGCLELNSAIALDNSAQRQTSAQIFSEAQFCKRKLHGDILLRTELFFGLSRSKGADITEAEFPELYRRPGYAPLSRRVDHCGRQRAV